MKKVVLTTLILFMLLQNGFCQEPSQAQIDKMMKDAQAMLAKFQQQAKDSSSFKKTAKKYEPVQPASAIVIIPLKQPLQIPTTALAKDHLLWYKGKKMNDSMIVTAKGLLVLYSKKQDKVTAQPLPKKDPFAKLVGNLDKTAQMTDDYVNKELAKKNSYMNYPLIKMAIEEFKMIDDRLKDIVKNTIDLPKGNLTVPQKSKGSDGESDIETMEDLNQMHQQLKQLLANKPALNFDPPPKKEFSLAYLCDTNAQHRYTEEWKKWEEGFFAYEDELIRTDLQIERTLALTGINRDADASLKADLDEGVDIAFSRRDEKIKLLTAQYGKDIFRQECVVSAVLQNERQKQLMGRSSDESLDIDFFFGPEFENYINEQIAKKNWDVILNISFFLGRERQAQLLGNSEANQRLYDLRLKVLKLNRFALTADINFNIQFTDEDDKLAIKANGTLETTDKVYVSLSRTRDGCKWTLMLSEIDYGNAKKEEYYIPMQVTAGVKLVNDGKGNWKDYPYSGPKDMLLHFPVFSIDFSEGGQQDSVTLEPVRYLNEPKGVSDITETYKEELLGFMNYIFIDIVKEPGDVKDILAVATEMMGKFANVTNASTSDTPLEILEKRNLLMKQKQEAEQKTAASFSHKAIVLFNAVSGSSALIDQSVDKKHKDGIMELTKAVIKIKVIHDPVTD